MTQLPKTLVRYLGIDDLTALSSFRAVLASSFQVLDIVLEDDGIVEALDLESSDSIQDEDLDVGTEQNTLEITTPSSTISSSQQGGSSHQQPVHTPSETPIQSPESDIDRPYDNRPPWRDPSPNMGVIADDLYARETEYARLLRKIVNAARRATIPAIGAFDLQALANSFPSHNNEDTGTLPGLPFGVRSQDQLGHDIKIGAAGELFVSSIFVL